MTGTSRARRGASGSENPSVKLTLFMAKDLVRRAIAAGGFQVVLGPFVGKRGDVAMQPCENLLALSVADRDRADAGAYGAQGRLMEEHCKSFIYRGARRRGQRAKDNGMMPRRV